MSDLFKNIEACTKKNWDTKTCNKIFLQTAIMAEFEAINLYQTIASKTYDEEIKKTMLDIAREEKTHIGEFQYLLKKIDKEFNDELVKGEEEVRGK